MRPLEWQPSASPAQPREEAKIELPTHVVDLIGGGGQDRTADLRVMKTPITYTINYLHVLQDRLNTVKYV